MLYPDGTSKIGIWKYGVLVEWLASEDVKILDTRSEFTQYTPGIDISQQDMKKSDITNIFRRNENKKSFNQVK